MSPEDPGEDGVFIIVLDAFDDATFLAMDSPGLAVAAAANNRELKTADLLRTSGGTGILM